MRWPLACLLFLASVGAQETVNGLCPDVPGTWGQSVSLSCAAEYGISAAGARLLGNEGGPS
jgi:hypothetical protein